MPSTLLLSLAAVGLVLWFWQDSLRAREQVLRACAQACRSANAQLLDQTVVLARLRPARQRGRLVLARDYDFEFTLDGEQRWGGRARLIGRRLDRIQMDHPGGVTIL